MKRALVYIGLLALFGAIAAQASPIDCASLTTLNQLIAANAGGGCYSQDKIFSNFDYSGAGSLTNPASTVRLTLVFQPGPGNQDVRGWSFNPTTAWGASFTLAYDVTVCTSVAQGCVQPSIGGAINGSLDQMNTGRTPNGTVMTDTQSVGNMTLFGTSVLNETAQLNFSPVLSVHTSSTSTFSGGSLMSSYEQDFFETSLPEPATYFMLAGGLMLLGLASKRFKKA